MTKEHQRPSPSDLDTVLQGQIAYYRARASEYDEWFFRQGRYDRGEAHKKAWDAEVAHLEAALGEAQPAGEILELACGTGLWTRHLAKHADHVTAIDAAREVLDINRARVGDSRVDYVKADIFEWTPEQTYDFVFFSFWLSHVPRPLFQGFWDRIRLALKPGGRVFFIDSLLENESTARNHRAPEVRAGIAERKLNDGSTYSVVKVFYEPDELERMLLRSGWTGQVRSTGRFFLYGSLS